MGKKKRKDKLPEEKISYDGLMEMELSSFFRWLKETSEQIWASYKPVPIKEYRRVGGSDWREGTEWIGGFSAEEIELIEKEWQLNFPEDYRIFLSVLGSLNKDMIGAAWQDDQIIERPRPSFYHWQKDRKELLKAFGWPLEGILFDVEENDLWLPTWGERPETAAQRKEIVSRLIEGAPRLIPVIGHRYMIEKGEWGEVPFVFSLYQSDMIIYGADLRHFLLREMSSLLGISRDVERRTGLLEYDERLLKKIPFWGALLLGEDDNGQ